VKGISKQAEEDMFLGAPIDKDPGVALLEEVARTAGHVRWLEAKVRGLREDEMVWTKTLESDEDGTVGEGVPLSKKVVEHRNEINKWWEIYQEERKHLAQVSVAALKAGVEERRVRLAERGVDALEAAITLALQDLGVDPHSERARQAIGTRLQEALGGPEDVFGYGKAPEALEMAHRSSQPVIDVEPIDF
jgi:hypothetical protein